MIHTNRAEPVLRTNQAAGPEAAFTRPRLVVPRGDPAFAGRKAAARSSMETWPDGRPNLLARVARAARLAVDEVRQSGDVPLPHLYRGRDFGHRRDAA